MQEHAIPQDVTGYKFHIVGNMTLGQFAQLVVGAIICFFLYQSYLYAIIKWPLIFLVVILSVVAAFIPIAERPLSHWIKTFFSVLYRPTKFAWRRVPHVPDFFLFTPAADAGPVLPELDMTPLRRKRIQEFIATTHAVSAVDEETVQVEQYVDHVFSLFSSELVVSSATEPVQVNKPSLRVRTRSMRANPSTPLHTETALTTTEEVSPVPSEVVAEPPPLPPVQSNADPSTKILTTNKSAEISGWQAIQDAAAAETVAIPTTEAPTIEQTTSTTESVVDEAPTLDTPTLITQQPAKPDVVTSSVTFNKELPFPSTPTTPNKLVGMILTAKSELIEGAIIEIRTPDGQVARAVRSNALGQFYVTTPLTSGKYVLAVEKAGLHFEPLSIELKGKIVDPIEIHSVG